MARYRLAKNEVVETSASETVEGSIEILRRFFTESGSEVDIHGRPENLEVEYVDVPFVFLGERDWRGRLVKLPGFTVEAFNRAMRRGSYSGMVSTYIKLIDPKTDIREKIRIYEILYGNAQRSRARTSASGGRDGSR